MKIYISKASESYGEGKVKEFTDLQECIEQLLEIEDFGHFDPLVVVSKADDITTEKCGEDCDFEVMIYDTWIE